MNLEPGVVSGRRPSHQMDPEVLSKLARECLFAEAELRRFLRGDSNANLLQSVVGYRRLADSIEIFLSRGAFAYLRQAEMHAGVSLGTGLGRRHEIASLAESLEVVEAVVSFQRPAEITRALAVSATDFSFLRRDVHRQIRSIGDFQMKRGLWGVHNKTVSLPIRRLVDSGVCAYVPNTPKGEAIPEAILNDLAQTLASEYRVLQRLWSSPSCQSSMAHELLGILRFSDLFAVFRDKWNSIKHLSDREIASWLGSNYSRHRRAVFYLIGRALHDARIVSMRARIALSQPWNLSRVECEGLKIVASAADIHSHKLWRTGALANFPV